MNNNYQLVKSNPVKFIEDEIAKNPSAHTNLPEIRDAVYCMQNRIAELEDMVSKGVWNKSFEKLQDPSSPYGDPI